MFPNVQLNVGDNGIILVRVYPDPGDPGRSISQVSFYGDRHTLEADPSMAERFQLFGQIVRDEDYRVAETIQTGAEAGQQGSVLFGRNEPALHHYHQTYRSALGMEPLPLIE
jgi:hypothetical protein